MDRIIEEGFNSLIIIEMSMRRNVRETQNYGAQHYRGGYISSYRNDSFRKVEVGLGKDSIQVILEGMVEAVLVDQDQVQEPLPIEIEFDVLNARDMVILLKTV